MNKPHKFKVVATNDSPYAMLAICEYCGSTAFYGNYEKLRPDVRGTALSGCPNSPDFTSILGTEILGMIQRIGTSTATNTDKE